ncbi:MAG: hypothetical protein EP329_08400 [Deltaproteobacteria bacterium]|nr:MAG: hypothetical protein EP329_08400 [Deltaproteobacteria bacterium]
MRSLLALLLVAGALPLGVRAARADSWCATPVWAHEWGVHVYAADGAPLDPSAGLPSWFHTAERPAAPAVTPVRNLPADTGVRRLPVVHFYAADAGAVPIGVEVGFHAGPASAWFPAVDRLRPASEAPQLVWDRLELTQAPTATPHPTDEAWIGAARALPARWVNRGAESDRFLFYEAGTAEPMPLALRRGDGWRPDRRALVLENRGAHPVHDLVLTHAERGETYVFAVPAVPAGGEVRFVLDALRVPDRRAATHERLHAALTDPAAGRAPRHLPGDCVMGRNPAVPFEHAEGHRLYPSEVELLLGIWGARFFEQPGTTVVWREDAAALDAAMPLSIYTDMFHHVLLRRAGLALWEHVKLP